MSGFTIDVQYVYGILSDLRENKSVRYIRHETDVDLNEYYVTIYDVAHLLVAENVKYILSVSPIGDLSTSLASQIVFYQVYVNPSTTELIVTPLSNATPISFSISNSLVYLFYNNSSYALNFACPYTDITGVKQSILSLFTYPCFIVMLYGNTWVQFSYIQTAYEPILTGTFARNMTPPQMLVHNTFDYNNTFVASYLLQPQAYWNSNKFASTNQLPYLSYTSTGTTATVLVTGFTNTYIIQQNVGNTVDKISISSTSSQNIPAGTTISGIQYSSLSLLVPLRPTVSPSVYLKYYLAGVAGIGYSGSSYATIQELNILNSNNVYNSVSALIVPVPTNTGLNRYGSTTFYYLYDPAAMTLTVWDSPTQPSFYSFLIENQASINTSDVVQLTTQELSTYGTFFKNNMNEIKMGWCGPVCIWQKIKAAAEAAAQEAKRIADAVADEAKQLFHSKVMDSIKEILNKAKADTIAPYYKSFKKGESKTDRVQAILRTVYNVLSGPEAFIYRFGFTVIQEAVLYLYNHNVGGFGNFIDNMIDRVESLT